MFVPGRGSSVGVALRGAARSLPFGLGVGVDCRFESLEDSESELESYMTTRSGRIGREILESEPRVRGVAVRMEAVDRWHVEATPSNNSRCGSFPIAVGS